MNLDHPCLEGLIFRQVCVLVLSDLKSDLVEALVDQGVSGTGRYRQERRLEERRGVISGLINAGEIDQHQRVPSFSTLIQGLQSV